MKYTYIVLILLFMFVEKSKASMFTDPFGACSEEKIEKTTGEKTTISFSVFTKKENRNNERAVLIMPPTGGRSIIDEGYAMMLCKKDFKVYILEHWTGGSPYKLDYSVHNEFMDDAKLAVEAILDFIPEKRIGLLGTSAGGIILNTLISDLKVERVKSYFSIVAGLSLCEMLAHSGEEVLKKAREERMKAFNIKTEDEYGKQMCRAIRWKTAGTAPDHIKLGTIISEKDKTVPSKYQIQLVDEWSPDVVLRSSCNHKATVIGSYFFRRFRLLKFFEETV